MNFRASSLTFLFFVFSHFTKRVESKNANIFAKAQCSPKDLHELAVCMGDEKSLNQISDCLANNCFEIIADSDCRDPDNQDVAECANECIDSFCSFDDPSCSMCAGKSIQGSCGCSQTDACTDEPSGGACLSCIIQIGIDQAICMKGSLLRAKHDEAFVSSKENKKQKMCSEKDEEAISKHVFQITDSFFHCYTDLCSSSSSSSSSEDDDTGCITDCVATTTGLGLPCADCFTGLYEASSACMANGCAEDNSSKECTECTTSALMDYISCAHGLPSVDAIVSLPHLSITGHSFSIGKEFPKESKRAY